MELSNKIQKLCAVVAVCVSDLNQTETELQRCWINIQKFRLLLMPEDKPTQPTTFEQAYAKKYPVIADRVSHCPFCGIQFTPLISCNEDYNCPNCTNDFHVRSEIENPKLKE